VSGGYDVNVRQMAADGIRVLGRVVGASDDALAVASNAWMHTFKSGLFSGVGSDAEYLAEHMSLMTGR
jgi:hypothetical protein